MIKDWFNCKVKYQKVDENGKEIKTTDLFLVDAVSYTDAETRIHHEMESYIRGAFKIINIAKSNYTDIINDEENYEWYKVKVISIEFDTETDKERKFINYYIVSASSCKEAIENLDESLKDMLSDYSVSSVSITNIVDVLPSSESTIDTETGEILEENLNQKVDNDFEENHVL